MRYGKAEACQTARQCAETSLVRRLKLRFAPSGEYAVSKMPTYVHFMFGGALYQSSNDCVYAWYKRCGNSAQAL